MLFLGVLLLGIPAPARAAEKRGERVLLIEQGRDPFLERVGAEVAELGFSLVRSDADGPLEASARAERAVAAIRVLPSRKGVEVWMADATSGRSLLRQVVVDENPRGPDRELVALQTAELLRTSLLGDQSPREHPGRGVEAPGRGIEAPEQKASAKAPPAATTASWGVGLAFGALYSPGGTSPAAQLDLSAHHFFGERWGIGVDLGVPVRPGTVTGVEGSASMGAYSAGASLLARFQSHTTRFFGTAGLGAALLVLAYDGETREPLRSNSGSRVTGAAYLRGDVGVEAATWMRVGLRALAGASAQRISVMFAGNEAGSFGPAFFAGFVLAEVPLP